MKDSKLRGVCVGAGYFAQFQYQAWNRIPEVKIVANVNRSIEKARQVAEKYDIPNSYPLHEIENLILTEKPDFIDIITPPETHKEICEIALRNNVSVICQKPVAPTLSECTEIAEMIKGSSARFMVHENWRWQPWYREIKSILESGVIGQPNHLSFQCRLGDGWGEDAYLARQPFFREYPRLFIYETGVHFLDTFRYLFGEVDSIYAKIAKRNPVIKGEDCALLIAQFENGVTTVLDANRYNESKSENPRYTFGTLRLDASKGHLELMNDGSLEIKLLGQVPYRHSYSPSTDGFAGDCVYQLQKHFVEGMISGNPFESELSDYLRSIILVEEAYESAKLSQVINSRSSKAHI